MKRLIRTMVALLSAAMLCGCSGNTEPKPRLDVDTTPVVGENCVTPPFWVVEDDSTGAQIFLLGSMHAGIKDARSDIADNESFHRAVRISVSVRG